MYHEWSAPLSVRCWLTSMWLMTDLCPTLQKELQVSNQISKISMLWLLRILKFVQYFISFNFCLWTYAKKKAEKKNVESYFPFIQAMKKNNYILRKINACCFIHESNRVQHCSKHGKAIKTKSANVSKTGYTASTLL